ncbi:hypothetical protein Q5P01_019067 [Channa striata]|uniref:Uncharacterized protein n=1 Tax=Channa striata TaxID=64152 RepID=A0AA88M3A7_CHASR|nr:hypothetical protein Q5P01_019067 [Channa striata]
MFQGVLVVQTRVTARRNFSPHGTSSTFLSLFGFPSDCQSCGLHLVPVGGHAASAGEPRYLTPKALSGASCGF